MVNSQEIVERTFYICLLNVLLEKKMGLNPEDYLPLSQGYPRHGRQQQRIHRRDPRPSGREAVKKGGREMNLLITATAGTAAQPGGSAMAAGAAGKWSCVDQLQHGICGRCRRRCRAGRPAARADQPGPGTVRRAWPDACALRRQDQPGLRRNDVATCRGR